MYKSLTSSIKCIPNYFILSDAIVSGIVFSVSLSDNTLLAVHGNTTDFCRSIIYRAISLNSFISFNSFLCGVFRALLNK